MNKLKKMLPYLIIIILSFYLLPFVMKDTGAAMTMLLVVIPAICFICSILYGVKNSISLAYVTAVAILFVPAIFIFYNASAWIYVPGYGIIALAGNAVGMIFYKRTKSE